MSVSELERKSATEQVNGRPTNSHLFQNGKWFGPRRGMKRCVRSSGLCSKMHCSAMNSVPEKKWLLREDVADAMKKLRQ